VKTEALPGTTGKEAENAQNRASLDEAVSQYWERIWAVLYRLTGDEHEAEDLALEVFRKSAHSHKMTDQQKQGSFLNTVY
jgi:DNA-directed RNA polymerase specialized sigma24 family protein